jgi:hypothetical protein
LFCREDEYVVALANRLEAMSEIFTIFLFFYGDSGFLAINTSNNQLDKRKAWKMPMLTVTVRSDRKAGKWDTTTTQGEEL